MRPLLAATTLTLLALAAMPAAAANYEVQMLNKGEAGTMVFEPNFLAIQPGDTVTFVPTDKSHNVENIKDMLPDGAAPFKSKVNEEFTMTFDVPGLYGFKCTPHWGFGMAFVAKVGTAANLAEAEAAVAKTPPMAKKRLTQSFASIK